MQRHTNESEVWPGMIVAGTQCRDHAAGIAHRRGQVFVQALLAHAAVDTFDQAILHRPLRCDVVVADLSNCLPLQNRIAGQFCAALADHQIGQTASISDRSTSLTPPMK